MKKDKNPLFVMVPILLFLIYTVLDYFNFPTLLGISIAKINVNIFNVVLDSTIAIVLYILTYYFVDERQIKKDENARTTADTLIYYTYKECVDTIKVLKDNQFAKKYIIPKMYGKEPVNEDKIILSFQNNPFSTKEHILELSKSGYIDENKLDMYLSIQKKYSFLVPMLILLYDVNEAETVEQKEFAEKIRKETDCLLHILADEINKLGGTHNG